ELRPGHRAVLWRRPKQDVPAEQRPERYQPIRRYQLVRRDVHFDNGGAQRCAPSFSDNRASITRLPDRDLESAYVRAIPEAHAVHRASAVFDRATGGVATRQLAGA